MATELGKAYVQIMPSAKGISGSIQKAIDPEAKSAGKNAGNSLVSGIKKIIAVAGIGKALSMAITEGAALQQSIGGIETLFKDSAGKMQKYASEAYKTVGVSANEYMENVTSFSASLLQSMGGDTEKAAEKANMAMIDMGDNANKMGTDMQSIQNAYQGFAKSNYTMLDNLKLGYGGTKSEMERLLSDATKLSGVKYDISNLDDVYSAIHVIQEEIGITGTTALEAEETLTGSFSALKASFKDLLGAVALGEDIAPMLKNLSKTFITYINNLLPMVANIISQVPDIIVGILSDSGPKLIASGGQAIIDIVTGFAKSMPSLIPAAVEAVLALVDTFIEGAPMMIQSGLDLAIGLIDGLLNAIPVIIERVPEIIDNILATIIEQLPRVINTGVELFTALVEELPTIISNIVEVLPEIIDNIINTVGTLVPLIIDAGIQLLVALVDNLPAIIDGIVVALPVIINSIVNALSKNIPLIIGAGVKLLTALITNLPQIIATIVKAMPQIISGMVGALGNGISKFAGIGTDIVKGLWQGIKDATGWLLDKVKGFGKSIENGIKKFFGIKSPSTLFRDEVGKNLALGVGEGFVEEMDSITKDMASSIPSNFDIAGIYGVTASNFNSISSLDAIKQSLTEGAFPIYIQTHVTSMMDGREVGYGVAPYVEAKNNFDNARKSRIGGVVIA